MMPRLFSTSPLMLWRNLDPTWPDLWVFSREIRILISDFFLCEMSDVLMQNAKVYMVSTFQILKHFSLTAKARLLACKLSATRGEPLDRVRAGSEVSEPAQRCENGISNQRAAGTVCPLVLVPKADQTCWGSLTLRTLIFLHDGYFFQISF